MTRTAVIDGGESDRSTARALFDLSRGRQALLSVAQPALGALIAAGGIPATPVVIVGAVAATAGYLAVFSLNDVLDRQVDGKALAAGKAKTDDYDLDVAFLRHPLAAGDISLAASLVWVAALGVLAGVLAYTLAPVCLGLFGASAALEVGYCALRSVTWAKTLVSGVMVGLGGLAGWAAVSPIGVEALPFFGFLAVWEIAGRNLPNDLADLPADAATGLKTVATTFGPAASAGGTLVGAGITVAIAANLGPWPVGALLAAALGIATMLLPAMTLVRAPSPPSAARYFNRASLYPALLFVALLALTAL